MERKEVVTKNQFRDTNHMLQVFLIASLDREVAGRLLSFYLSQGNVTGRRPAFIVAGLSQILITNFYLTDGMYHHLIKMS